MIFQILAGAAAAATIFTFIATWLFWWVQRRSQMIARTYDLYRYYWSPEHFKSVMAPMAQIVSKWYHLEGEEQAAYRHEVAAYWLGYDSNETTLARYTEDATRKGDHMHHFNNRLASKEQLTEADALNCHMHFWSGIHELMNEKMVERRATRRLFKVAYGWRAKFFADLRKELLPMLREGDPKPDWIKNTEALDRFFR